MLLLFYIPYTYKYCDNTGAIHQWYLNYMGDPDKDLVTLFFYLNVDLPVL